jgi:hypothetical protein
MAKRRFEVFNPSEAAKMAAVFDECWQLLINSQSNLAMPTKAEATREALALRIVELAQEGLTDPQQMCS